MAVGMFSSLAAVRSSNSLTDKLACKSWCSEDASGQCELSRESIVARNSRETGGSQTDTRAVHSTAGDRFTIPLSPVLPPPLRPVLLTRFVKFRDARGTCGNDAPFDHKCSVERYKPSIVGENATCQVMEPLQRDLRYMQYQTTLWVDGAGHAVADGTFRRKACDPAISSR